MVWEYWFVFAKICSLSLILPIFVLCSSVRAETLANSDVEIGSLARDSWNLNPLGESNAIVCKVDGPDGFLSVRSGPGTSFEIKRNLKALATVVVDTSKRKGHWIYVATAYRDFDENGKRQKHKSLHVQGWASDAYLCDFIDY